MSQQPQTANRTITGLAIAAAIVSLAYAVRHTVSCFLMAFVIAYLLDPLLVKLERRRCSRPIGIALLYLILAILSAFFVIFLVPLLSARWEALIRDLPRYVAQAKTIVVALKSRFTPVYAAEEWSWLLDTLTGNLDSGLGSVGSGLYATASQLVFNLFNLVLAPILVFFMLYYKQAIIDGIKIWLPSRHREDILVFGREVNDSIGGYIRGQLIVSVIVAIMSAIALFFLDVDNALFLGMFAGFASILPFIGVILATIPPVLFAYLKFQTGLAVIKVISAFAVIYFLEGYLIKPLVFKESMDLNPLLTIIVVMAFGELMGFWGILLAIPIAAAFKILSTHLRRGDYTREA